MVKNRITAPPTGTIKIRATTLWLALDKRRIEGQSDFK
jgi:hypothetical protein